MPSKYYQKKDKERLRKEAHEKCQYFSEEENYKSPIKDIKLLIKKKKGKSVSTIVNDTKICLRIKSKGQLSLEETIM